jgi:hypothetical protein
MSEHLDLIDWWTPTALEERPPGTREEAAALVSLEVEPRKATLRNRGENLHRAIGYYQAALPVYTEADFPADWAMMQYNLGIAYRHLPRGTAARTCAAPPPATRRHCGCGRRRTSRRPGR